MRATNACCPTCRQATKISISAFAEIQPITKLTEIMKQENKETTAVDVQPYIDALMHTFSPAATPEEATHFFTTAEVMAGMQQINSSLAVSAEQVAHALTRAGFRLCNRPGSQGISFRWMFREKVSQPQDVRAK